MDLPVSLAATRNVWVMTNQDVIFDYILVIVLFEVIFTSRENGEMAFKPGSH